MEAYTCQSGKHLERFDRRQGKATISGNLSRIVRGEGVGVGCALVTSGGVVQSAGDGGKPRLTRTTRVLKKENVAYVAIVEKYSYITMTLLLELLMSGGDHEK